MIVDREKVQRSLEGLDGEEALRRLLERELGYDYEGGRISADGLLAGTEEELAADPALVASTASRMRVPTETSSAEIGGAAASALASKSTSIMRSSSQ